jgi:methylthioribose-1-phosphate isomerase
MKIKEIQTIPAQGRNPREVTYQRVIEVDTAPEGAEVVNNATPVTEWEEIN